MTNLNLSKTADIIFKTFKYISLAGLIFCLYGLSISIKKNYPLWVNPLYTEGTIINYKTVSWESRRAYAGSLTTPTSANLPIVEFQSHEGKTIQFTDNLGHNILKKGASIPVIYAKNNPSNAVVNKGAWGWFNTYIWLFGAIASSLGILRFNKPVPKFNNANA